MRTIRGLRKRLKGRIYIRCSSPEVHQQLLLDAEAEGYRVGGRKPTDAEMPWDIIVLEKGRRLCYTGYADHEAFKIDKNAYRVDYAKYSGGAADFLWHDGRHETAEFSSQHYGECRISGRQTNEALDYYRRQIRYFDTARDERMLFAEMEHVFKVLVIAERKENDKTDFQLLS